MATPETAINGTQTNVPPYIAHRTFTNFINGLAQAIPDRIDKSIMRSLAGSTQGQLMSALKYFKLISDDGTPQPALKKLVESEGDARKKAMAELVKRSYDFVFSSGLNLQSATTAQVEELFTKEGVQGETRRKAFSFFLALCKDADIQLSKHIKPPKGVPGTRRRARNTEPTPQETEVEPSRPTAGTAKTIQLKSGGELSLLLTVNLFGLDDYDRKFVFDLIDKIQTYENETKATAKAEPKPKAEPSGAPQE
jgi:hypothetical protein